MQTAPIAASAATVGRMIAGDAHAYYCDTRALGRAHVDAMLRLLSSAERERHNRLLRASDRRDYAAAHTLLRVAIGAHTRTAPGRLVFAATASGKPFLVRADGDAEPPSFSLAHSRAVVACVIAPRSAVGIDVEAVDAVVRAGEIARHYFSPEEAAALQRCAVENQSSRFCELWTLKEALLKALGTGLALPLHCVSFQVDGAQITLTQTPPLAPTAWAFRLIDLGGTHKLAVAISDTSKRRPRVRVTRVDPLPLVDGVLGIPTHQETRQPIVEGIRAEETMTARARAVL